MLRTSKSKSKAPLKRPALFDDDEDPSETSKGREETRQRALEAQREKDRQLMESVLQEDPNVYAYDEVYDQVQDQRKTQIMRRQQQKADPKVRLYCHSTTACSNVTLCEAQVYGWTSQCC